MVFRELLFVTIPYMYNADETIAAISSASENAIRQIIRISGNDAANSISKFAAQLPVKLERGILKCRLNVCRLELPCSLYYFEQGKSYTGDELIEMHVVSSGVIAQEILNLITSTGVRLAEPGEFTARAYLNGKMDLAQAEAVAEIISSSNFFQLEAAQKLLKGSLSNTITKIRASMLELISLLEAGLDFTEEDIEFISAETALKRINDYTKTLQSMLNGCIRYEAMIDLPSVGIVGIPNAGKSSLLNNLLETERSIVSPTRATTRDILTGLLKLENSECVIFDCAGITISDSAGVLDEIAQESAKEAILTANLVIFTADLSSEDFSEDIKVFDIVKDKLLICIGTKADKCHSIENAILNYKKTFGHKPILISNTNNSGLGELKESINEKLREIILNWAGGKESIAITQRHRETVTDALNAISEAIEPIQFDDFEVASMFIRNAWVTLGGLEKEDLDEQILDNIFGQFCIGK